MAGKSRFRLEVLALFGAFVLFCGMWFLVVDRSPEPYRVDIAQHPEAAWDVSGAEEGWPDSLLPGEAINVNTADVYDLQRLPGIGETRALAIVAWREEHGPFQTLDGLTEVYGIGPGILEGLREYAVTGNE